jgi:hypothetical protein
LRFEFTQLGIDSILDRLTQAEADYLDTQIAIYTEHQDSDEAELIKRFDVQTIDMKNPESMFSAVYGNIKSTRTQQPFHSFLSEILLIPVNSVQRHARDKLSKSN